MNHKYNIHPGLYIGGFIVLFRFPIGTLIGLAIGIGVSKKWSDYSFTHIKFVKEFTSEEVTRYTETEKYCVMNAPNSNLLP